MGYGCKAYCSCATAVQQLNMQRRSVGEMLNRGGAAGYKQFVGHEARVIEKAHRNPTSKALTVGVAGECRGFAAVLGDQQNAWGDGTLDPDEIAADPEAAALAQAFREQLAEQMGTARALSRLEKRSQLPGCVTMRMPGHVL